MSLIKKITNTNKLKNKIKATITSEKELDMNKDYTKCLIVALTAIVLSFFLFGCGDLNINSESKEMRIEAQETQGETNINVNSKQNIDKQLPPTPTPRPGAIPLVLLLIILFSSVSGGCVFRGPITLSPTLSLYNSRGVIGSPTANGVSDSEQMPALTNSPSINSDGGGALDAKVQP